MKNWTIKLFKISCLFLWLYPPTGAHAQTFQYPIAVESVDFLAPVGMEHHKISILRDDFPHKLISGLAWDISNTQTPVGFCSGVAATVVARFSGCDGITWAKGDGPGLYDPPPMPVSASTYEGAMPAFTPGKVDFYEPFEITWYVSRSASGPWIEVGKSRNPLYVTHGQTPITSTPCYHSLIYYGCKHGKGLSDPDLIVDAVYTSTFSSQVLPRKDNPTKAAMSYWAFPEVPGQSWMQCFTTEELLRYENGRCDAWAWFFIDMLKVQEINLIRTVVTYPFTPNHTITLDSDILSFFGSESNNVGREVNSIPHDGVFFVKDWDFSANKFYSWDQEWRPYYTPTTPLVLQNGNTLLYAPKHGDPAQGNDNPMSTFANHAIVAFNGKYYDPSYGTAIQPSKELWEDASLLGFGTSYNLIYTYMNGSMPVKHRIMWLHEENNSSLQSTINP